jgi:hypothetical protein
MVSAGLIHRVIQVGPRGGRYYINENNRRCYPCENVPTRTVSAAARAHAAEA